MKRQVIAFMVVALLAAGLALASEFYMSNDHWYAKDRKKISPSRGLSRIFGQPRSGIRTSIRPRRTDTYRSPGMSRWKGTTFIRRRSRSLIIPTRIRCCIPDGRGAGSWWRSNIARLEPVRPRAPFKVSSGNGAWRSVGMRTGRNFDRPPAKAARRFTLKLRAHLRPGTRIRG